MKKSFGILALWTLLALSAVSLWAEDTPSDQPKIVPQTRPEMKAALEALKLRQPRLPLADDAKAAQALPNETASPIPNWMRAFATGGGRNVSTIRAVAATGRISPKLKAQIAWCTARENRAWYAAHDAKRRLNELGVNDEGVFALDNAGDAFTPAEQEAFAFARKLTSRPHTIADADIARLRRRYSDHETAEIVYVVCQGNLFDRVTEAFALPLDE